jgi:hypothetical protein
VRLEAIEVGRDQLLPRGPAIALPVCLQATLQSGARSEQARAGLRLLLGERRLRAQIRERRCARSRICDRGEPSAHVLFGHRGEASGVARRSARCQRVDRLLTLVGRSRLVAHRQHVERQAPALMVVQLRVRDHGGTGHAEGHREVRAMGGDRRHALGVEEVGGLWIERASRSRVRAAIGTVTARTASRDVELRAETARRRLARCEHHLVLLDQQHAQVAADLCNLRRRPLLRQRRGQLAELRAQWGVGTDAGLRGQCVGIAGQRELLVVLPLMDDGPALVDSAAVVTRDVVQDARDLAQRSASVWRRMRNRRDQGLENAQETQNDPELSHGTRPCRN